MSSPNKALCDDCGQEYAIGDWPFCPHGPAHAGTTAPFVEYWDEHVAPPPGPDFKPTRALPEYHPDKGYRITNLGDRRMLMKLNRMDYRSSSARGKDRREI